MVDLSEFVGDNPMRASLVKKQDKVREKIEKFTIKLAPLLAEDDMYSEMIAAIDRKLSLNKHPAIVDPSAWGVVDEDAQIAIEESRGMVNPFKKKNHASETDED